MADSQLQPGTTATRAQIRDLYGGSNQGGIVPSNTSNSVLLFSDPAVGHGYGYHDGWASEEDDGGRVFEYTGAGAVGDQAFTGGNKAILNHVEAGRTLRVFVATGTAPGSQAKLHRYEGEFRIDARQPYQMREALDGAGDTRQVIVFRLRPVGDGESGHVEEFGPSLASLHSDSSTAEDLLGNWAEVDRIAKLSLATTTVPPLAIALLGEWGAGKSSFMVQMDRRVRELADLSAQAKVDESSFVSKVRQIHFNAWHYSDERVWSGLIAELFRSLAEVPEDKGDDPSESVEAERNKYDARLEALRERSRRLEDDLERATAMQAQGNLIPELTSPREIWPLLRAAGRELRAQVFGLGFAAIALLVITLGAVIWGRALLQPWIAVAAGVALTMAPLVKIWKTLREWLQKQRKPVEKLRVNLEEAQRNLNAQIITTRAKLAEVNSAVRLADFLSDRDSSSSYQAYQGLLAMIHKDLTRLDEELRKAQEEWVESGVGDSRPLQRIILYVDDLDRCPPERVVEVLAAIHLMLALPLFVVVVAVDPRWLIRCLRHHHKELFSEANDEGQLEVEDVATPVDYLDKIFQIALTVPPATPEKTARLLESLLDVSEADDLIVHPGQESEVVSPESEVPTEEGVVENSTAAAGEVSADSGVEELAPAQMQLSAAEASFMVQLSELLPTPRATKKLVNLYRLVRMGVSVEEFPRFLNSSPEGPAEYQVVQFLLALLVGHPEQSNCLFRHILNASSTDKITDVLRNGPAELKIGPQVADVIERVDSDVAIQMNVETYQRWCPLLARYSFYTRRLCA